MNYELKVRPVHNPLNIAPLFITESEDIKALRAQMNRMALGWPHEMVFLITTIFDDILETAQGAIRH